MKKKIITLSLSGALCYIVLAGNSGGLGAMSHVEGTGVSTTGCSCHSVSATSSITVAIQLLSGSTPVTSYTAGGSYTIKITGVNTGSTTLPKFGFQATAMKTSSTTNAGTLSAPTGGQITSVGGKNVAEQSAAITATTGTGGNGSTYVVNIPWTAPAAGTGSVTLRSVINAVNGSGGADASDKWNTASLVVPEAGAAAVGTAIPEQFSLYPNPCNGSFSVQIPSVTPEDATVTIVNMAGQQVRSYKVSPNNATSINTGLPAGAYIVVSSTTISSHTARLIVQ